MVTDLQHEPVAQRLWRRAAETAGLGRADISTPRADDEFTAPLPAEDARPRDRIDR